MTSTSDIRNENGDRSFLLESKCLNFFSKWVGGSSFGVGGPQALSDQDPKLWAELDKMWLENPEYTLRLIFYKGDCRGGAQEKRLFLVSYNWLLHKHRSTGLANLTNIPFFRYWKDLLSLTEMCPSILEHTADLFASQLKEDLKCLTAESKSTPSLCAKWVPNEDSAIDKKIPDFLSGLRKRMKEVNGATPRLFRKNVVVPLRKAISVVETQMCAGQWTDIKYSNVPSVAMERYRKAFQKRDPEGFAKWLQALKKGEAKVNVSQLFPHTVVQSYLSGGAYNELTEQQFQTMVNDAMKLGSFDKSVVISDVSGSMAGVPMDVSISLGILIGRCAKFPFTNQLVSFSDNPSFHQLSGSNLHEDVRTVRNMPWGGSTNLDATFELLLARIKSVEDVPTRLYILTDMQFNEACLNLRGDTETAALQRGRNLFASKGYTLPEIVCWNLRGDTETAAMGDNTPGMCMISGFSPAILKTILKGKIPSPIDVMIGSIMIERYDCLVLVS